MSKAELEIIKAIRAVYLTEKPKSQIEFLALVEKKMERK